MKKVLCLTLIFALTMCNCAVFAANTPGSIAGHYYYTDIKTYFYGAPIQGYNLNGKTAIVIEDLNWHYGHDVYWYANERKLTVDKKSDYEFSSFQALAGQTLRTQSGKTGTAAGDIYYTDIKTYLNGKYIDSYNIGGQTVVICEDMNDYGYDITWDEEKRELRVTGNDSNFYKTVDIGRVKRIFNATQSGAGFLFSYQLTIDGKKVNIDVPNCILMGFYDWVPLLSVLKAMGTEYEWDSDTMTFTVTSVTLNYEEAETTIDREILLPTTIDIYEYIDFHLFCKDREIPIILTHASGHFENAHEVTYEYNPILYNGIVYVPINAIADCFGYKIDNSGGIVTK